MLKVQTSSLTILGGFWYTSLWKACRPKKGRSCCASKGQSRLMRVPVLISAWAAAVTVESERRFKVPSSSSLPYLRHQHMYLGSKGRTTLILTAPKRCDADRFYQVGDQRMPVFYWPCLRWTIKTKILYLDGWLLQCKVVHIKLYCHTVPR